MDPSIFITTTIPYINSKPHIGHAQEFAIADCLARSYRARGCRVTFQTGTDENAFKNVVAARGVGIPPQKFVDQNSDLFRRLVDELDISVDTFIRTTEIRHRRGVEEFWHRLKKEDLYPKSYKGLYCVGCEDFYLEKDLVDNGLCPDHRTRPDLIAEENIFFRLSAYQDVLEDAILRDQIKIVPQSRKNEVLSFIRQGLQDISLTRASARSDGWGIPVPGRSDQVIYVWIDALVNYLTGQSFGETANWEPIWNENTHKVHVIGKNVWKFHAVYWPALLLSVGLPLPNEIVVHGFLTNNGVKISKSLGNAIDPLELIREYGADAVRHLLLTYIPTFADSDFSTARVAKVYTDDFAHRLGNLFSRLWILGERAHLPLRDRSVASSTVGSPPRVSAHSIQETSLELWRQIDEINAEIHQRRPWELLKSNQRDELHRLLEDWFCRLHLIASALHPFVPAASEKVLRGLAGQGGDGRILFPLR